MLILKLIGGYILILIGSFMVFCEVVAWRDFGYWEAIKAQGISFLPLSAYLTPIIGLLLLYFGSFVIVKTFKGHLKRNDTITIKSKPVITSIVYF